MQLEFIVENQRLTRTDKNFVVEKSQNYLYAHFDFKTDDWNRTLNKYAIFTNDNYNDNNDNSLMVELQDNNTCLVPHTILLDSCYFKVNLVGTDSSGNFILTTNVSNVSVNKTGSTSGISPDDPQPSILAELLEKVNKSYSNFNFEYNEENGKLLLELIDNDKVVYSKEVDLPMEQVVKNVKYDNNTKILTIEWVNGQSTKIDFSKFTDTYLGDEKTIHLENNVFSIKKEWLDEINNRLNSTINIEIGDERYLKKESAIIEEHEISEAFYERTTASDSTGSKYEIENGSLAKVKYLSGMSYKSENLLAFEDIEETTVNGLTYSAKNGIIYLNGTTTANIYIKIPCKLIGVGTYTSKILEYKENGVATDTFKLAIYFRDSSDKFIIAMYDNYRQTLNITNDLGAMELVFSSGLTYNNVSFGTMVVSGTTAPTEYQQGFEGLRNTAVTEIKSVGNNLISIADKTKTTINGITYSVKDGVITLNGTSTKEFGIFFDLLQPIEEGTYIHNSFNANNEGIVFYAKDGTYIASVKHSSFSTNNVINRFGYVITNATTFNNYTFSPMIVKGSTPPTEYQPYWEETLKIPESVTSIEGYGDGLSKTDLSKTNYVDFGRDKFVQNVNEITLDGTETNSTFTLRTSPYTYAQLDVTLPLNASLNDKMLSLSNSLTVDSVNIWNYENKENTFIYVSNNKIRILFSGTTYTTKEELNAYLQANPITIGYLLETPIETDIDLVDRTYKVDNLGTETLVNEYNQKAFASIEYGVSLKSQIIENSENIANLKNDKLDKVIGSGGTDRVYGIDMSGKQIVIPVARYDMYTNTNCLARVDSNGEVKGVTTGRTYTAFTNVEYVQNNFETIYNSNLKVQNLQNIINKQAQRIEQLELASEGTILSTYENVSEVSYNRLIGANVLPYGTLDKVGGMTYKSENLLNMPEYSTTVSGVKVKTSGTEISFVGTPTSQYIGFAGNTPLITLPKGSYIMKVYDIPDNYGYRMINIQNGNDYPLQPDTVCVIPNEMSLRGILTIPSDLVNTEINFTIKVFISRTTNYINFTPISNSEYNLTKNVLTVDSLTTDSLVFSSNTVTLKAGPYSCNFMHWLKSQPTSFSTLVEIVNETGTVITSRTLEYKNYQQVVPINFTITSTVNLYIRITITCENLQNWECRMSLFDRNYISGIEYKPYYSETGLRNTKVSEVISNGANLLNIDDFTSTNNGITFTYSKGHMTIKGTFKTAGVNTYSYFNNSNTYMKGKTNLYANKTYVLSISKAINKNISLAQMGLAGTGDITKGQTTKLFTNTKDIILNALTIGSPTEAEVGTSIDLEFDIWINEGTTAKPYTPYKEPIHYAVPPKVQALQGYSVGINKDYNNYTDYNREVFGKACKVVQLGGTTKLNNDVDVHITSFGGSWVQISSSNGQFLMQEATLWKDMAYIDINSSIGNFKSTFTEDTSDGVQKNVGNRIAVFSYSGSNRIRLTFEGLTTKDEAIAYLANNPVLVIYPLETPVETDISQYLTSDNIIELEALGSLTFENEHKQAVPNEISYQERNI